MHAGSECVNAFHRASRSKGGSALYFFNTFHKDGYVATFRRKDEETGELVFTLTGMY